MAQLGVRTFDDLIGRADLLDTKKGIEHWKAQGPRLLAASSTQPHGAGRGGALPRAKTQDHGLDKALDIRLIEKCAAGARARREGAAHREPMRNVNRTVGTMLSGELIAALRPRRPARRHHPHPAGRHRRAELRRVPRARASRSYLIGDTNDYTGKGLSGGRIAVRPRIEFRGEPTENIIIGNIVLYGAIERRGLLPRRRRRALRGAHFRRAPRWSRAPATTAAST